MPGSEPILRGAFLATLPTRWVESFSCFSDPCEIKHCIGMFCRYLQQYTCRPFRFSPALLPVAESRRADSHEDREFILRKSILFSYLFHFRFREGKGAGRFQRALHDRAALFHTFD